MCARPANPELRAEILRAATRIVEECGPDCVTMREVAHDVGYSPTTLYLYFKDKHAILSEVVLAGFDELAAFCDSAMVGPTSLDKLRQRCSAYVVWGVLHPSLYQLMFVSKQEVEVTAETGARMTRSFSDGVTKLEDAMADGEVRGLTDAFRWSTLAWAGIHGVTSLSISRRLRPSDVRPSATAIMDTATGLSAELINGLLVPYLP